MKETIGSNVFWLGNRKVERIAKIGRKNSVGMAVRLESLFGRVEQRIIGLGKGDPMLLANRCDLLVPALTVGRVIAIHKHPVNRQLFNASIDYLIGMAVKKIKFLFPLFEFIFQIFERLNHELQTMFAFIGIRFDLLRGKNKAGNH